MRHKCQWCGSEGEMIPLRQETFGKYTALEGKLDKDDSRAAYVTGPTPSGAIRPIASFWFYEEARQYASKRNQTQG